MTPRFHVAWSAAAAGLLLTSFAALSPAPAAAEIAPGPGTLAPVTPLVAVRLFDPPPRPWMAGHRGVDLAAGVNMPVASPASGTVTFAGLVVNRGVVTITHHNGLRSSLEPIAATVERGDRIEAGEVVGTVEDRAHHCRAPCVHWGVRRNDEYVDPLTLLPGFGPVRLLPLLPGWESGQIRRTHRSS